MRITNIVELKKALSKKFKKKENSDIVDKITAYIASSKVANDTQLYNPQNSQELSSEAIASILLQMSRESLEKYEEALFFKGYDREDAVAFFNYAHDIIEKPSQNAVFSLEQLKILWGEKGEGLSRSNEKSIPAFADYLVKIYAKGNDEVKSAVVTFLHELKWKEKGDSDLFAAIGGTNVPESSEILAKWVRSQRSSSDTKFSVSRFHFTSTYTVGKYTGSELAEVWRNTEQKEREKNIQGFISHLFHGYQRVLQNPHLAETTEVVASGERHFTKSINHKDEIEKVIKELDINISSKDPQFKINCVILKALTNPESDIAAWVRKAQLKPKDFISKLEEMYKEALINPRGDQKTDNYYIKIATLIENEALSNYLTQIGGKEDAAHLYILKANVKFKNNEIVIAIEFINKALKSLDKDEQAVEKVTQWLEGTELKCILSFDGLLKIFNDRLSEKESGAHLIKALLALPMVEKILLDNIDNFKNKLNLIQFSNLVSQLYVREHFTLDGLKSEYQKVRNFSTDKSLSQKRAIINTLVSEGSDLTDEMLMFALSDPEIDLAKMMMHQNVSLEYRGKHIDSIGIIFGQFKTKEARQKIIDVLFSILDKAGEDEIGKIFNIFQINYDLKKEGTERILRLLDNEDYRNKLKAKFPNLYKKINKGEVLNIIGGFRQMQKNKSVNQPNEYVLDAFTGYEIIDKEYLEQLLQSKELISVEEVMHRQIVLRAFLSKASLEDVTRICEKLEGYHLSPDQVLNDRRFYTEENGFSKDQLEMLDKNLFDKLKKIERLKEVAPHVEEITVKVEELKLENPELEEVIEQKTSSEQVREFTEKALDQMDVNELKELLEKSTDELSAEYRLNIFSMILNKKSSEPEVLIEMINHLSKYHLNADGALEILGFERVYNIFDKITDDAFRVKAAGLILSNPDFVLKASDAELKEFILVNVNMAMGVAVKQDEKAKEKLVKIILNRDVISDAYIKSPSQNDQMNYDLVAISVMGQKDDLIDPQIKEPLHPGKFNEVSAAMRAIALGGWFNSLNLEGFELNEIYHNIQDESIQKDIVNAAKLNSKFAESFISGMFIMPEEKENDTNIDEVVRKQAKINRQLFISLLKSKYPSSIFLTEEEKSPLYSHIGKLSETEIMDILKSCSIEVARLICRGIISNDSKIYLNASIDFRLNLFQGYIDLIKGLSGDQLASALIDLAKGVNSYKDLIARPDGIDNKLLPILRDVFTQPAISKYPGFFNLIDRDCLRAFIAYCVNHPNEEWAQAALDNVVRYAESDSVANHPEIISDLREMFTEAWTHRYARMMISDVPQEGPPETYVQYAVQLQRVLQNPESVAKLKDAGEFAHALENYERISKLLMAHEYREMERLHKEASEEIKKIESPNGSLENEQEMRTPKEISNLKRLKEKEAHYAKQAEHAKKYQAIWQIQGMLNNLDERLGGVNDEVLKSKVTQFMKDFYSKKMSEVNDNIFLSSLYEWFVGVPLGDVEEKDRTWYQQIAKHVLKSFGDNFVTTDLKMPVGIAKEGSEIFDVDGKRLGVITGGVVRHQWGVEGNLLQTHGGQYVDGYEVSLISYHKVPKIEDFEPNEADLWFLESPFPSRDMLLSQYRNSYILYNDLSVKTLFYIDPNGNKESVNINDYRLFDNLTEKGVKKVHLPSEHLTKFITSNGGHTLPVKSKVPTLIKHANNYYMYGQSADGKKQIVHLSPNDQLNQINFGGSVENIQISSIENKMIYNEIKSKNGHADINSSTVVIKPGIALYDKDRKTLGTLKSSGEINKEFLFSARIAQSMLLDPQTFETIDEIRQFQLFDRIIALEGLPEFLKAACLNKSVLDSFVKYLKQEKPALNSMEWKNVVYWVDSNNLSLIFSDYCKAGKLKSAQDLLFAMLCDSLQSQNFTDIKSQDLLFKFFKDCGLSTDQAENWLSSRELVNRDSQNILRVFLLSNQTYVDELKNNSDKKIFSTAVRALEVNEKLAEGRVRKLCKDVRLQVLKDKRFAKRQFNNLVHDFTQKEKEEKIQDFIKSLDPKDAVRWVLELFDPEKQTSIDPKSTFEIMLNWVKKLIGIENKSKTAQYQYKKDILQALFQRPGCVRYLAQLLEIRNAVRPVNIDLEKEIFAEDRKLAQKVFPSLMKDIGRIGVRETGENNFLKECFKSLGSKNKDTVSEEKIELVKDLSLILKKGQVEVREKGKGPLRDHQKEISKAALEEAETGPEPWTKVVGKALFGWLGYEGKNTYLSEKLETIDQKNIRVKAKDEKRAMSTWHKEVSVVEKEAPASGRLFKVNVDASDHDAREHMNKIYSYVWDLVDCSQNVEMMNNKIKGSADDQITVQQLREKVEKYQKNHLILNEIDRRLAWSNSIKKNSSEMGNSMGKLLAQRIKDKDFDTDFDVLTTEHLIIFSVMLNDPKMENLWDDVSKSEIQTFNIRIAKSMLKRLDLFEKEGHSDLFYDFYSGIIPIMQGAENEKAANEKRAPIKITLDPFIMDKDMSAKVLIHKGTKQPIPLSNGLIGYMENHINQYGGDVKREFEDMKAAKNAAVEAVQYEEKLSAERRRKGEAEQARRDQISVAPDQAEKLESMAEMAEKSEDEFELPSVNYNPFAIPTMQTREIPESEYNPFVKKDTENKDQKPDKVEEQSNNPFSSPSGS